MSVAHYPLGHTPDELSRLEAQARLVDPITRRYLVEAGLSAGMRVLDVGCGIGDVSLLAAELVGRGGEVVGIDRSCAALNLARQRAFERGASNVRFMASDAASLLGDAVFDALIARYVLVFQPDPVPFLRALVSCIRPGGLLFVHEVDFCSEASSPPAPSYDQACHWVTEALQRCGVDPAFGARLAGIFHDAGLPPVQQRSVSLAARGEESAALLRCKVDLLRTLLPEIERLGIARASDIAIDTVLERMRDEVAAAGSVINGRLEIGTWTWLGDAARA